VSGLNKSPEKIDDCTDLVKKLRESRNDRLGLPLSKMPERYARGDFALISQCSTNFHLLAEGKFSLLIQFNLPNQIGPVGWSRDKGGRNYNCQLTVLIESIHIVDDEKKIIREIGPSIVRLQIIDKLSHLRTCDSLYFSVVLSDFVFLQGLSLKHGELKPIRFLPSVAAGEVPNDVVKAGAQMMYDFPGEDAKSPW
jgi:hypothetical protein